MAENAVACKLPTFWSGSPEMWFRRAEAQFLICKVTDSKTKAALVLAQLDEVTAGFVHDVGLEGDTPFEKLQAALIKACGKSKRQRVAELFDCPAMGSESPERFGVRLQQLAEGVSVEDVIREVFLRGLPKDVSKTLVNHSGEFSDLSAKAGTFFTSSGAAINASSNTWTTSPQEPFSKSFCDESSASAEPMVSAHAAGPQYSRQPPRQRQGGSRAPRSRAPRSRQGGGDVEHRLCWYHDRWGRDARRCVEPCFWSGNAPAGNQR